MWVQPHSVTLVYDGFDAHQILLYYADITGMHNQPLKLTLVNYNPHVWEQMYDLCDLFYLFHYFIHKY